MNNPPRILLLQLISNGDCLYATAIARQIKQDYPGCHLTWAIASSCKAIIENNPYVDAVWEIPNVSKKNCLPVIRKIKKEAQQKKEKGEFDEVFFTQIIDENLANYDGTIRSSIFRGYGKPITVPVTPVLRLRNEEIAKAEVFAEQHYLHDYKNVILFEFAPQSGQLAITPSFALQLAKDIVDNNDNTAIILSSNIKLDNKHKKIIDGSQLTIRETAALTHHCTLLLGCSSGITWISTSDAAKQLPMVQILDPYAFWVNPISRDFERCGFSTDNLLEIYKSDPETILKCVGEVLNQNFTKAKQDFSFPLPLQFNTTRRSVYNMLCALQIGSIIKHIRINVAVWGWQPLLFKELFLGIITAPFKLIHNIIWKHILKKAD